jgi:hypothetical protein
MTVSHVFFTQGRKMQHVPLWDYKALLDSLGTNAEIAARIGLAGYDPPTRFAVRGWRFRGRIPSQWLPLLLIWAFQEGKLRNINELLLPDGVVL